MPLVGFEPTISAGLRPRGHWDRQSNILQHTKEKLSKIYEWNAEVSCSNAATSQNQSQVLPPIIGFRTLYDTVVSAALNRAILHVADRRSSDTDLFITHSGTLSVLSYRLRLTNASSGRFNELMVCISYNTSLHFCYEVSFTSFLLFVALNDLGLHIVHVSRSHSDTPHLV
jgi:hypothetical protein